MSDSTVPAPSKTLKTGIVGFGTFGQFLANTMIKQGHKLRATSRTDYSQLCAQLGVTFFSDVGRLLEDDNDVILICTSILSLSEVLKSIPFHCLRKPTLFVDVLSVKEYPREALLQVVPEDSDVLCTHPMFGPDSGKHGWRDLNFMYECVRVRDDERCSSFLQIFEKEPERIGAQLLSKYKLGYIKCRDAECLKCPVRITTNWQRGVNLLLILLEEIDIEPTPIDTKGFATLLQLRSTTENNSFDLFSGLFIHNKYARQELKNLESALEKVKQTLLQRMEKELDTDGSTK